MAEERPIYELRTYTNGRRTVTCLHPRRKADPVLASTLGPVFTDPTPEKIVTEQRAGNLSFHATLPRGTPEEALSMPEDEWMAAIQTAFEMIRQKMEGPRLAVPRHMAGGGGSR